MSQSRFLQFLRSNLLGSKASAINAVEGQLGNSVDGSIVLGRYKDAEGNARSIIGICAKDLSGATSKMSIFDLDKVASDALIARIDNIEDTLGISEGASGTTIITRIEDVEKLLTTLNGDVTTEGSIKKQIKDAVDAEASLRSEEDAKLSEAITTEATTARAAEEANAKAINDEVTTREEEDAKLSEAIATEQTRAEGQEAAIRSEFAAADTKVKEDLIGDAETYTTLGALEDAINTAVADAKTYSIVAVTEGLGANVKEAWKLVDEDGVQSGSTISIYKDSALKSASLGTATVNNVEQDCLILTYVDVNGVEQVVNIPLGDFLRESEFSNGLAVSSDGVVTVKVAEDSETFLTVTDKGVKLSGIQSAINTLDTDLQGQIDNINNTTIPNLKSAYEATDTALQSNIDAETATRESEDSNLQTQIDAITGTGTTSISTKIEEAVNALDVNEIGNETTVINKVSQTDGKVSASVININNGLTVSDSKLSVNVSEDTEDNKNFLDYEGTDGSQSLAVRSMDTDVTVTTDRILVAGGPLDSTSLRALLPKDESGNAYIAEGTNLQDLLLSLFTKVEWPEPKITEGSIKTSIAAPTVTLDKNGTVEVGTVATLSEATLANVTNSTTARTVSPFTYGYATSVDGSITKTTTTVSVNASNITVNADNYTMKREFTGFTNTNDSATPSTTASDVKLASVNCTVVEGSNNVKVSVTGPKGICTFAEMPSYFVASNIGTLSSEHVSPSKAEATLTASTAPSNSKTVSVIGSYYYFMGYSTNTSYDQFDSASVRALTTKSGWITKDGTTTIVGSTAIKSNGNSIVVACPSKYKLATIANGLGADILANFSSVGEVDVTTGSITTKYKVYVYPITNGAEVEFKNVTLTKA